MIGSAAIIKGVTLEIEDGSFVVFVGPSGSGKTTLLRLIAGLEDLASGRVLIDGSDVTHVPASKRGLAMVFQSYALYPHMTVRGNIEFALRIAGQQREEIDRRVRAAASMLGLDALLDRRARELSGGERQRVAIGRAIVREPRAFLFDEPLSNLDAALRSDMRVQLSALQRKLGATTIYVTHDQLEAMTMADRVVVLNKGAVEQVGVPADLYRRPANRFVAGFIGSPRMNFLEGVAASELGAHSIGVRPDDLKIAGDGGGWSGTIVAREYLGSDTFLHVDSSAGHLTLRVRGEERRDVGAKVWVVADRDLIHRFDGEGRALAR